MRRLVGLGVRAAVILLVGAVCGVAANLLRPQPIAWVEDWGHYIEALAYKEGLALAGLPQTQKIAAGGTHIVFDARPELDYAAGHIPGALSFPYDDYDRQIGAHSAALTPAQPILAYCSGPECDDALMLLKRLREQGFTNVVLFAGGWAEWAHGGE